MAPTRRTSNRANFVTDPLTGQSAELLKIQPYAAAKIYRCPGCNQEITTGVAHFVVVPLGQPDERRHWHLSCWKARANRRPG